MTAYQSCVMDTTWVPTNPILPVTPQFLPQKKHNLSASQIGFKPSQKNGSNDLFVFVCMGKNIKNSVITTLRRPSTVQFGPQTHKSWIKQFIARYTRVCPTMSSETLFSTKKWGKGINGTFGEKTKTSGPSCDVNCKIYIGNLLKFYTKNISFALVFKKRVIFRNNRAPPL